jgi:hypothetical protein
MIAMLQRIEELESRMRELECERADCEPLAPAR